MAQITMKELLEAGADTEQQAGVDGAAPRKRTRRGSRGGRSRKRKPAAVNGDGGAPDTMGDGPDGEPAEAVVAVPAPAAPEAEAEGHAGYVPMSEWLDDFDRR